MLQSMRFNYFLPPLMLLSSARGLSSVALATKPGNLLVLGGTGFVGKTIIGEATKAGWKITSLSRRGRPKDDSDAELSGVDWQQGDATDPALVKKLVSEGGFDAVVHAIGMLFASSTNKLVSGSGSVPSPGATYDQVTRQTAVAAAEALAASARSKGKCLPMVFVSAAEARWTFDGAFVGTPVEWLHAYLVAKRAVEDKLLNDLGGGDQPSLRPIVLRPSLVWTPSRPFALPPVAAFTIGNFLGLPFVDRPVRVDTLAAAAMAAVGDQAARGVFDYSRMEALARQRKR